MRASGWNGTNCNNYWSSDTYYYDSIINAKDGLKFIFESVIGLPLDNCPENTTWTAIVTGISQPIGADAEVTMRRVCGGALYDGFRLDENGWIYRKLDVENECTPVPATTDRECWIQSKFDNESLEEGFRAYGGPSGWDHGGVYRNGVYQKWNLEEVKWDGKTGYIRINNYGGTGVTYYIVYLPPNGNRTCAYTNYTEYNSSLWTRSRTITRSAKYGKPYQKQWTESGLKALLNYPSCPCTGCNCNQTVNDYSVAEYQDPDDAITLTFNEPSLTVTGRCDLMDFTQNYTETVVLADYMGTGTPGSYDLSAKLIEDGNELAEKSHQFHVCEDLDGDGYCEELGDCNDTDPSINPDAQEICDYKDNNCDWRIDEDFYGEEFECVLGRSCNDWNGSICNGTCMCTQDELNVTCNSTYSPGELDEVCLNELDDDCDGVVDEMFDLINDTETEGCIWRCEDGTKRLCSKNIGFCTPGERKCINGTWGKCIGFREPREETCNLALNQLPRYADDDCDGVIDNVYGGESIEEAKCQCYNGNSPKPEECNGIDDDCDREIDERVCRCSGGETKSCGNDKGICELGIQHCVDGFWATECTGGVGPDPRGELCYNKLDDNCDGETDENCVIALTCKNDAWDLNEDGVDCGGECPNPCEYPAPWIIISIVVISFITVFIILEIKGKIPM